MNSLIPRIIVVDDLYGKQPPNHDREDLCMRLGIQDVSPDNPFPETVPDPQAEVVFSRAQIRTSERIENDLPGLLKVVREGWKSPARWALLLLDLHFKTGQIGTDGEPVGRDADRQPDRYFGLRILEAISSEFPDLPVVVFSSMDRREVSRKYAKHAAVGFLLRETATRAQLSDFLWRYGLIEDSRPLDENESHFRILGHSLPVLMALRTARQAVTGRGNILLLGETGVGKELLARYVHDVSPCRNGPFHVFFTQDTTESIFEDKLFGHVKGAFTGAIESRPGMAELSNGGSLFIDECGDIPLGLQHKFLRILDEKVREVQRQGSNRSIHLQLQIILATNKNIDLLEESGDFRGDLLHRIPNRITLPPLRERREDIPILAEEFLQRAVHENKAMGRNIESDAMDILLSHTWPGNVRELLQTIEDAVRRFPDVEHLVPVHLQIKSVQCSLVPCHDQPTGSASHGHSGEKVNCLVSMLDEFSFPDDYLELKGKLIDLQKAIAQLLVRYLKAALMCPGTRKFTPANPEGEINLTAAVKCITGQDHMSTTKAADIVKRLLHYEPRLLEEIQKDPVLGEALDTALRHRPKRAKRSTQNSKHIE